MADLTPDHPAVLAADAAVCEKDGLDASYLVNIPHAINAALPRLTADDLRNTPAVRELMAEAWAVGKFDGAKVCEADHFHHPAKPCTPNPYKATPDE